MNGTITIKDIARLAKVSQSTVSKALNDRPDVSLDTKEHVLKIAAEHNFLPNASGKALKKKSTENIGVIFRRDDNPLSSNPFYSRVLEGIEAELAFNDYNLLLHLIPEHRIPVLPKMVRKKQVDAVVLVGIRHEEFVQQLQQAKVPVILVDPKTDIPNCSQVLIDNENGAFLATQHLIQNDHERIDFISGELSRLSFKQRLDGYVKALRYHSLPVGEQLIKAGGVEAGYELTRALLLESPRPTAIVAANDINAIYGYKAVNEFGLRIPDDISMVGFDDIDLAKMATPPLTTVRVYKEELGSVAVRNLRQLLQGKSSHYTTTIIPVRLVQRESVRNLKKTEP